MILDIIENIRRYNGLNPGFTKAADFLCQKDILSLPVGKYEIDGDRVYAMVAKDQGRKKEDARLEIHKKYIDIQLILSGTDLMGWKPLDKLDELSAEYDPEKDIAFYSDEPDCMIPISPGMFAIFFPEDAHMPLISENLIHKVVVKILEDVPK